MTHDIHDLTDQIARCHDPEAKRLLGQELLKRIEAQGETDEVAVIDGTVLAIAAVSVVAALCLLGVIIASVM
jgi:hypothetical protein